MMLKYLYRKTYSKVYLLWVPFHWLKRNCAVVSLSVLSQSSLDNGGLIYGKSVSSAITRTWK